MRALAALILLAAVVALIALLGRQEHQPLLIEAEAETIPMPPGQAPVAVPDPYATFAPCPLTPRNVPMLKRRIA